MAITAAQLNVAINVEGAQKAKGEIASVGDAVDNAEAKRKMLGAGLLGMGGAIAGVFAYGTTAAIDFGEQMANVNSIAQLTTDELAAVSDEVLKIATNTGQGPEVLAAGLYDIYSSGFQGAEGLHVLEVSAMGANAGLTTTATSAKGLTAVLNAYNLTADDSGHIMDVMFQTVNEGVITFEELSSNMANTIPLASALGVSFEELAAGYAIMTKNGVPAAQTETQLSALMRSAINPTEALTAAVQAYGYTSVESLIATEGLTGYLNLLTTASGGTTEGLFNLLGTAEATNAALLLGGENADEYTASVKRMEESSEGLGATQTALNKQMESTAFGLRLLKTNIQAAAIAIGVQLEPGIKAVAKVMTTAIKAFLNFSKPVQQIIGIVTALAGALALVAGGIILFGSQIAAAAGLFLALLGPIALVVAAVAGLYFAWQSNFMGIQDITADAIGAVMGFLEPVTDFLGDLKSAWDASAPTSDVMSQINEWGGITSNQMGLVERAMNALDIATGGMVTRLREMTALEVAVTIGGWVINAAVDLASAIGSWLLDQAVSLVHNIPSIAVSIGGWIVSAAVSLWDTVKSWIAGSGGSGSTGDPTGASGGGGAAAAVTLSMVGVTIGGWIISATQSVADAIETYIVPVAASLSAWTLNVGLPAVSLVGWNVVDAILTELDGAVVGLTRWTMNVNGAEVVRVTFDIAGAILTKIQENPIQVALGAAAITLAIIGSPIIILGAIALYIAMAFIKAMPDSVAVSAGSLMFSIAGFAVEILSLMAEITLAALLAVNGKVADLGGMTFNIATAVITFGFNLLDEITAKVMESVPTSIDIPMPNINFTNPFGGSEDPLTIEDLGGSPGGGGGGLELPSLASSLGPLRAELDLFRESSRGVTDGLKEAFTATLDTTGITTGLATAQAALTQFQMSTMIVTQTMAQISMAFTTGMATARSAVTAGMAGIVSTFTSGMGIARTAVVSGVAQMTSSMVAGMATFRAAVTSGMASAVAAVRSGIAQMVAAASAGRGQMMSAGLGIGAALGQGIAAGIRGQIGAVAAAAAQLVTTAVNAARAAGAINSPSLVMDREVGQMLGLGAALGVERMYPRMDAAMAGLISVPTVPLQAGGGLRGAGVGSSGGGGQVNHIDARFINNAPIYGVEDLNERFAQHTNDLADAMDRHRLAMGVKP